MKQLTSLTTAILLVLSTQAFAGGDNGNNGVGNECQGNSCGGIGNIGLGLSLSDEEEFIIEGETEDLAEGCSFFYLNDGTMEWNEDDHRWYTIQDAQVRVKTRDVLRIVVDTNKELQENRGTIDEVETVDYEESDFYTEHPFNSPTMEVSENEIVIDDLDGGNVLNIDIDHTLEPSDSFVAEDFTHYWMVNKVSCVQ